MSTLSEAEKILRRAIGDMRICGGTHNTLPDMDTALAIIVKENWKLATVTAEHDRLRAALEKYADIDNWMCTDMVHECLPDFSTCCCDNWQATVQGYEVARAALTATKGG